MAERKRLAEIKCGKCGEMNRLPSLFCRKCGERLDYGRSERELLHPGKPVGAMLAKAVRGAVLLAAAAGLALAVWPARHEADAGGAVDARRYEMGRALLEDALARGAERSVDIAARDLNAFLAANVRDAGGGGGFAAHFRGAGAEFGDGEGLAWLEMERGPLALTAECRFAAAADGKLRVEGARFGHLPLPGALGRWYVASRKDLWRVFSAERKILAEMESAELRDGTMTVRTRGR